MAASMPKVSIRFARTYVVHRVPEPKTYKQDFLEIRTYLRECIAMSSAAPLELFIVFDSHVPTGCVRSNGAVIIRVNVFDSHVPT